jgi:hypothetical protein
MAIQKFVPHPQCFVMAALEAATQRASVCERRLDYSWTARFERCRYRRANTGKSVLAN